MSEKRQQPTTSLLESLRGYERHAVLGLLFLGVTLLFLAFPFSTTNLFNESCGADCMAHKRQLLQDELNVESGSPLLRGSSISSNVWFNFIHLILIEAATSLLRHLETCQLLSRVLCEEPSQTFFTAVLPS
ncbi:hypothetical protein CYMTET_18216 [Cymbomonas tetramitiformis]|uniref:Uncharacterized protein n=1 Tax=Cymbomonas tetramitiformis TaxID=36881 RepID=A0AAE0G8Q6_9CHLO|nr:hypothetical protein CYMTET_18216 [Cymbomonas tetramitiformis]